MESRTKHISWKSMWQFLGIVLLTGVLLVMLLGQTNNLFGQSETKNIQSLNGGNTAVTFPNNKNASIAYREETEIHTAVPNGAVDGNLYVTTSNGNSNSVPFELGASSVPTDTGEAATWDSTFSGVINTNTTWNTNLLLTGDITVPVGVTLNIDAGTTIFAAANSDDQNSGYWNDKTEIIVFGTLFVNGTELDPVYFTSNAVNKSPGDWGGIQFREGSTTSTISSCMVQHAIDGIRIYSWDIPGGGDVWAKVQNCALQNNEYGIHIRAVPHWPNGQDLHLGGIIENNFIANNQESGIHIRNHAGYKSVATNFLINNNTLQDNKLGLYLRIDSWWLGHTDERTIIRNNTFNHNETYGIYLIAQGSSDSSGSDTDSKPTVENNLLYDNQINIALVLDPKGSDGLQDFQPTVRYNTFQDAPFGIVISDTQPYDTFIPTINHNVFKGFDDPSSYAIANYSSRTVNIDHNYWGATPAEWDAGMPATSIMGTVNNSSPLTSISAPIITRFASSSSQIGENTTIYGANFGTIDSIFLPVVLNQIFTGMNPIFIGDAIPQRNVASLHEVFYSTAIQIPEKLPTGGNFYLSSQPNSLTEVIVDDEIVMKMGNTVIYTHDFSAGGFPQSAIVPIPNVIMENIAGETITVEYRDVYGNVVTASEIWLIWVP